MSLITSRGTHLDVASQQWANRPDDERFVSLDDMYQARHAAREASREFSDESGSLRAITDSDNQVMFQKNGDLLKPNNWSMNQICSLTGTPFKAVKLWVNDIAAMQHSSAHEDTKDGYQRKTSQMIKDVINHGLDARSMPVKFYHESTGTTTKALKAVTGPDYSRIYDFEIIDKVRQFVKAQDAKGVEWKVPGTIDWSTHTHIADVEVTKQNTTLYAGDRDMFLFLCADRDPIDLGMTPEGKHDVLFPGFILGNSEVGAARVSLMLFLFRGICQNRCIWGAEGVTEFSIKHTKEARERMLHGDPKHSNPFIQMDFDRRLQAVTQEQHDNALKTERSLKAASQRKAYSTDEDRERGLNFLKSNKVVKEIIDLFPTEHDGRPIETRWDMVNAITAKARSLGNQDKRLELERSASKLLRVIASDPGKGPISVPNPMLQVEQPIALSEMAA